jgi:eukaryotic-like serine/threonine-protein kinase
LRGLFSACCGEGVAAVATSAAPFSEERYRPIRQLDSGGQGQVWLAHDTVLDREVVLKKPLAGAHCSEAECQRLLTEARRAGSINDPNIATVHDVVRQGDQVLLVMEYVEGHTLRTAVPRPCAVPEFLKIAKQMCDALAAAHAQHVIHCDIKPGNIMLSASGQVKVLDFGIARLRHRADETVALNAPEQLPSGTPGYMAPELLLNQHVDERADIFSLGVVFYELLTGCAPFEGATRGETLQKTLHGEPKPFSHYGANTPGRLERLVMRMLAKRPAERCKAIGDVLNELAAVEREFQAATISDMPMVVQRWWHTLQKRCYLRAAVMIVAGAVALRAGYALYEWSQARNTITGVVTVIPFHVIGGRDDTQALADGLRETLTTKLTRISATHRLQVISASEVARRKIDSPKAARNELGADYVIEGSFHRATDTVRVTYALVETKSMRQLASDLVTAKTDDPFGLEDRVANGTFALLKLKLTREELQALPRPGTTNATAFEVYLQGLGNLHEWDRPEKLDAAVEDFQRALSIDSRYARAFAGLGRAYWMQYERSENKELIRSAKEACGRARQLDASLAESYICLGTIANGTGAYQNAVGEFRAALVRDGDDDDALRGLARAYDGLKLTREAEQVYVTSIRARPQYWAGYVTLGTFYADKGRYDEALRQFEEARGRAPDNALVHYSIAALRILKGEYEVAVTELKLSIELRPTAEAYTNLGQAYLHLGQYDNAVSALEHAAATGARTFGTLTGLADAYLWHGAQQKALDTYRQSALLAEQRLSVNAHDVSAQIVAAYDHARLGNRKEALRQLATALRDGSDDSEVYFYAARTYKVLGLEKNMMIALRQAIAHGYSKADMTSIPELSEAIAELR